MKSKLTTKDSVVSLFSGAGGMSLGFAQAGAPPVIAAELDKFACETYRRNLTGNVIQTDLSHCRDELSSALSGIASPLALIGGPPCQGFSSAGMKSGGDPRNRLIFNYLAIVARLRPRWFLFENVEGILTSNRGRSLADLVTQFVSLGYRVRLDKVNFAAYGLPQARKRVLLIGNRLGLDFALPLNTHSFNAGKHRSTKGLPPAPSIDDALMGLGAAVASKDELSQYQSDRAATPYDEKMRAGNESPGVYLHFSKTSTKDLELIRRLRPGQTMKDLPEEMWHESYRRRANRRVMDGTPSEKRGGAPSGIKRLVGEYNSLTITSASTREFIHPHFDRPLTLREAARLQSFPDAYEFAGNAASVAQQIGNAFPPLAAERLAKQILTLEGSFGADRRNKNRTQQYGGLIGYSLTEASGMSPALLGTKLLLEEIIADTLPLPFPTGEVA